MATNKMSIPQAVEPPDFEPESIGELDQQVMERDEPMDEQEREQELGEYTEEEVVEETTEDKKPPTIDRPIRGVERAVGAGASQAASIIFKDDEATREANGDDLSDLFRAPSRDDPDMQTDDLISVSEEDVFGDGGEDMSDLLEVTDEDVMGDEDTDMSDDILAPLEEEHRVSKRTVRKVRRTPRRYVPPSQMGGMRY